MEREFYDEAYGKLSSFILSHTVAPRIDDSTRILEICEEIAENGTRTLPPDDKWNMLDRILEACIFIAHEPELRARAAQVVRSLHLGGSLGRKYKEMDPPSDEEMEENMDPNLGISLIRMYVLRKAVRAIIDTENDEARREIVEGVKGATVEAGAW